jgi:hypothetical protein
MSSLSLLFLDDIAFSNNLLCPLGFVHWDLVFAHILGIVYIVVCVASWLIVVVCNVERLVCGGW